MHLNKTVTAVLAASALVFPTAIAPSALAETQPPSITVEEGRESAKELAPEQREAIDSALARGDISVNTDVENLAVGEAIVAENAENQNLVMIPIKNEGTEYSNLTLVLDENQRILSYSEAHFVEEDSTSGHVTSWTDGEKTLDRTVDASEVPAEGDPGTEGVPEAIDRLNDCLSAAGIPAWVVAAATAVCSFGSLPGYIACLTAAGVGGGTAGYCAGEAWEEL